MKVGILQFRPVLGDKSKNLKTIGRFLRRRKFDLAVLPELCSSGYNFSSKEEAFDIADKKGGETFSFIEELAVKTGGAIVWGFPELSRGKLFNSAALTTPEGDHHIYRKTHLFYREKFIFEPGNSGFKVFKWRGVRIGLMICFDWIFPEAARSLAIKKAQIICHPSNLVMEYCQDAHVTRSLENGVFIAMANRSGLEKNRFADLSFSGRSQVTDNRGGRILSYTASEERFGVVKIKPELADIKDVNEFNNLFGDRRVDLYQA